MSKIEISEIGSIFETISNMKGKMDVIKKDDFFKLDGGSKHFEAHKDGRVFASMPLHSFETRSARSLEIQDNVIKVNFEDGEYTFRL